MNFDDGDEVSVDCTIGGSFRIEVGAGEAVYLRCTFSEREYVIDREGLAGWLQVAAVRLTEAPAEVALAKSPKEARTLTGRPRTEVQHEHHAFRDVLAV